MKTTVYFAVCSMFLWGLAAGCGGDSRGVAEKPTEFQKPGARPVGAGDKKGGMTAPGLPKAPGR